MIERPDWNDYFITLAFVVSQRSFDPSTKHGAILVSADKRILSTGYNGPIRNSIDSQIPLERPQKYAHMIHAEENCILSYNGSAQDLVGSTMFITGEPCHRCLRMIIQKGIKNLIYGPISSACVDPEDIQSKELMMNYSENITIIKIDNKNSIEKTLNKTLESVNKYFKDEV